MEEVLYTISNQGTTTRGFQLSQLRRWLDTRVFRIWQVPGFLAGAFRRKGEDDEMNFDSETIWDRKGIGWAV